MESTIETTKLTEVIISLNELMKVSNQHGEIILERTKKNLNNIRQDYISTLTGHEWETRAILEYLNWRVKNGDKDPNTHFLMLGLIEISKYLHDILENEEKWLIDG